jgi:hypothetical protein
MTQLDSVERIITCESARDHSKKVVQQVRDGKLSCEEALEILSQRLSGEGGKLERSAAIYYSNASNEVRQMPQEFNVRDDDFVQEEEEE